MPTDFRNIQWREPSRVNGRRGLVESDHELANVADVAAADRRSNSEVGLIVQTAHAKVVIRGS